MRIVRFLRRICLASTVGLSIAPGIAAAQKRDSVQIEPNYWRRFTYGAATSILLHEAAHLAVAVAVGSSPYFGFDKLRPTVYSGINSRLEPHKQFLFSAAGLTMQSLIDEAILDIPHHRGSAFERGVLGGGIGTTVFYLTIGRQGSVSDVEYMARMHGLTRTQATLLFGGVAALHTIRISRDRHYANFFARSGESGGVQVGLELGAR